MNLSKKQRSTVKLTLEHLEDRCAPSSIGPIYNSQAGMFEIPNDNGGFTYAPVVTSSSGVAQPGDPMTANKLSQDQLVAIESTFIQPSQVQALTAALPPEITYWTNGGFIKPHGGENVSNQPSQSVPQVQSTQQADPTTVEIDSYFVGMTTYDLSLLK